MSYAAMTPSQRDLAARPDSLRLARGIAGRRARLAPWLADDIRGAALLGLAEAAARYDPAVGPFPPFAARRIYGAIADLLRAERPKGHRAAGGGPATGALAAHPPDPADPPEAAVDFADYLHGVTAPLPADQRTAVRAHFTRADCAGTRGLAARLGVGSTWASALVRKGLGRARRAAAP